MLIVRTEAAKGHCVGDRGKWSNIEAFWFRFEVVVDDDDPWEDSGVRFVFLIGLRTAVMMRGP